jgi:hypothetical protein
MNDQNESKDVQDLQEEQQEIANAQQEELNAQVPEDPRNKPNPVAGGFAGESSAASDAADGQTPVAMDGTPAEGDEETQGTVYPEPVHDDETPDEDPDAEPDEEPEPDETPNR